MSSLGKLDPPSEGSDDAPGKENVREYLNCGYAGSNYGESNNCQCEENNLPVLEQMCCAWIWKEQLVFNGKKSTYKDDQ